MNIEVYSDGSATTADKPGGWAWVLIVDGIKHCEGSGHEENVSNNDMELQGALEGLTAASKLIGDLANLNSVKNTYKSPSVTLCSDSKLVLGWASGEYRFKQENKLEKYVQLQFLVKTMDVKTEWIPGHSGHPYNERCDKLANDARKGIKDLDKSSQNMDTRIGAKKTGVVCLWYGDQLKIIDLENHIVENYNREVHGKRGSIMEIREEKSR